MNARISKAVIKRAVDNCRAVDYPVAVTGSSFGDDLSDALTVIDKLVDEVETLSKLVNDLLETKND